MSSAASSGTPPDLHQPGVFRAAIEQEKLMTYRENLIRTVRFENPDYIPMNFEINNACWNHYDPEALRDLMEEHRLLFPGFRRSPGPVVPDYYVTQLADAPYRDPWGCVWETSEDGITGSVHQHPLDSWDRFEGYRAPNPRETDGTYPICWEQIERDVEQTRRSGGLVRGGLPHGHTFLRLQDLRGYTNLLYDMTDEEPQLLELIEMVSDFNYQYIMRWVELQPDMLGFPEDLGMQVGPMLSPAQFRKYIKPVYQRCMKPVRDKGIIVYMHSDGDIRDLVDDLIDGGVEVINLQDLVNGIDWIAGRLAGKVCIDLDIDRQKITSFGSPQQIEALILEEVRKIGRPQGGLMMTYGLYPGVPLPNVKALMDVLERCMGCFSG
jgi:uroporphyrinogen decarboxylase